MIVWAAAALLGAILVALEFRRHDPRNLALRVVAVSLAVICLAVLLQPPSVSVRSTAGGVVVLLTEGSDPPTRRHLSDSLAGAPVLTWPDSVADLDALRRRFPGLRTLVLAGWGLRASMLSSHHDVELLRRAAPLPAGFEWLDWTREVTLGDPVWVRARLKPGREPRLVRFQGPDGVRDSLPVARDSAGPVVFRTTPAAVGVASLVIEVDGSRAESLAVVVRPNRPPRVLVLEGSPAFETSFLRRWLAGQGASMAIRTTISRGRDRVERVNLPPLPLRPLNPALLDRFDVVLLDGTVLATLGKAERAALAAAVEIGGMGLLVAPDTLARKDPDFFPFRVTPTGDLEDRLVRPLWPGRNDRSATPVPAGAESIDPAPTLLPLMRDPVGRILAGTIRHGAGRVGTSVVQAPSRWLLEEEPAPFAGYWSTLLRTVARRHGDQWSIGADGPVIPGLPVSLILESDDSLPQATVTSPAGTLDTLGLVQDLTNSGRWWGRYWPAVPGVYTVTNRGGDPHPMVVEAGGPSMREAAARLAATGWWAEQSERPTALAPAARRTALPPLLPFGLLVISLGLLWGEARGVALYTSNP